MGRMAHHTIVITSRDTKLLLEVRLFAIKTALKYLRQGLYVTEIYSSQLNNVATFFIIPDGSKEGSYEEDYNGDQMRTEIIQYIESMKYEDGSSCIDYAEVMYGEEENRTAEVQRHN